MRLADKRFVCGRVLQVEGEELPTKLQSFFGGLHSWIGAAPPTPVEVRAAGFSHYGAMHVRAIKETGTAVAGHVPLSRDLREIPTLIDSVGGPASYILKGVKWVRPAERNEWGRLPVLGFWGLDYILQLAEEHHRAQ